MKATVTAAAAGAIDVGGDLGVTFIGTAEGGPEHLCQACEGSLARLAAERSSEAMGACAQETRMFPPWARFITPRPAGRPLDAARGHGASARQAVLAWLLARNPEEITAITKNA
jgi:aryl-alcohol dehydrogenase-like predicted oxidoreductase